LFSFGKNSMIEFKFFFIESVYSFHVFHTFLQNLHLLLQLDLLLSLIVGILSSQLFKFLSILILFLLSLVHILLLKITMLLKQLFNFPFISLQNLSSFSDEVLLNIFDLSVVVTSHLLELVPHALDQLIDIVILLFEGFDILFVLVL